MGLGRKAVAILMSGVFLTLTATQLVKPEPASALTVAVSGNKDLIGSIRSDYIGTDNIEIDNNALALTNDVSVVSTYCDSVLAVINTLRQAKGFNPLDKSEELDAAAAIRSQELALLFSHTRPNGKEFWTVNSKKCYAECLARGNQDEIQNVVQAWMYSIPHKNIIMNSKFKSIGINLYEQNDIYYVAIELGF